MTHDVFGEPVTLAVPEAVAAWDATALGFLAHGAATPEHLGRLLDLAPNWAAGHALRGLFCALLGRPEALAEARRSHARATALPPGGARERALTEALGHVLARRPSAAIATLEAVLARAPGDTLLAKLVHAMRFVTGDAAGMRRSVERVLDAHATGHPGRGYLLGCHAFALEETGDYAAAERSGRAALELAPDDAWGLHAVAHVFDMTADAAGGLAWLEGRETAWAHCNNFRHHVWWHLALMLIDLGRLDAALALYDDRVRAERTDDYRDIANATSLLMRLELEGVDVGARWGELADLAAARTEDGCLIFADLHYMLALTGGGRGASSGALLARIARDAADPLDEVAATAARPGLAAARGLARFGAGDWDGAFADLLAARPEMSRAGGSHAQRDVFERMTIDAGLRAGRIARAGAVLADRTARRGGREDGYAAARQRIIAQAQHSACAGAATA
jgi:tetratricopeptide (TPR) repeat protein